MPHPLLWKALSRISPVKPEPDAFADPVNGSSSSGLQLPAVAQLQLPSSQPAQATATSSTMSQQALSQAHEALMHQSMMGAAAANPAPALGALELPSASGQGHGQPTAPVGMQEHPSAKQHMLHAISDGAAMVQVRVQFALKCPS